MSKSLTQLLSLRRNREQQAAIQLQRALARQREHEKALARAYDTATETAKAATARIAELYRQCVNDRLSRGDLDLLGAQVDGQYARAAETRAAVLTAEKTLAGVLTEVDTARAHLIEQSRNVQKLDLILADLRSAAERAAEINAEAEAERPPGSSHPFQDAALS